MRLSQKCCYALRAVLELARRGDEEPVSIATLGQAEGIPPQFLQVIMRELRQGGFVASRRGKDGGYLLTRPSRDIRVGEVVRFLDGSFSPVEGEDRDHPAFARLWQEAEAALNAAFDAVSLQDLLDRGQQTPYDFVI